MRKDVQWWIGADMHFYHNNMLEFENRPYDNMDEMIEDYVKRWNSIANQDDKVFILGDFSFGSKERTKEVLNRLNGYKTLIMGNHDRGKTASWWRDAGFWQVYEYPIIFEEFFILSHEPQFLTKAMPYANFHGHLHSNNYEGKQYFNVGIDNTGKILTNLNELIERFSEEGEGE